MTISLPINSITYQRRVTWIRGQVLQSPAVWLGAAVIAALAVWFLQLDHRSTSLAWDDATRVRAGIDLQTQLAHHNLGGIWAWINRQTFYPFLMPMLHGILMWVGFSSLTAGWLPSLAAYMLAGVLTAQLARAMGGNRYAAWLAAVLFWSCPVIMRLAAWGAMENVAACLYLGMILALVRIEKRPHPLLGILAGVLAASACFLKYDFGVVAGATLVGSAPLLLLRTRKLAPFAVTALAVVVAAALIGGWLHFNQAEKLQQATTFIRQGSAFDGPKYSALFYLRAMVGGTSGLSPLVGRLFLVSALVALVRALKGQISAAPILLLGIAVCLYCRSQIKDVRFVATTIPFFAVFGALLITQAWAYVLPRVSDKRYRYGLLGLVTLVAAWQGAVQATGPNGPATQFSFVEYHASSDAFIRFTLANLKQNQTSLLFAGATNGLNTQSLELVWHDAHPGRMPRVTALDLKGIPDAETQDDTDVLVSMASNVVALDIKPGSSLFDGDPVYLRQQKMIPYLKELEEKGVLRQEAVLDLEDGRVQAYYWSVVRD